MTNHTDGTHASTTGSGGLKRPLGPTGETVRANIIRLRAYQRLGYTELSERLKDIDKPITPMGLRRIENGGRRVDTDDLFALAVALGVSPTTLLVPDAYVGDEEVAVTGVTEGSNAEQLWKWMRIEESIDPDPEAELLDFWMAALPMWKKRQTIKRIKAQFSGGGGLSGSAGEAE
jgi:transcriptional regulator with XRE-family HTH domain